MSNYIPTVGALKKRGILAKREKELVHHLKHGSEANVVERHAEHVRAAQLALVKALLSEKRASQSDDEGKHAAEIANLLARQASWNQMSAAQVIDHYHKTSMS